MQKLKLAFMDSDKIGSRLIRALTWSDFSHVGMVNGDQLIDSRMSTGGVTVSSLKEVSAHYPRVEIREYDIPADQAWAAALTQVGKPYDLTAIIGIPFRRDWQTEGKWFCSELVAWSCSQIGYPMINKPSWRVVPQDLYQSER